ncbi:metallophosphoesterase [Neobacillus vireti]|uniref:metallophosphoesterase n=1 Tax=Neobacillus vireti TaxID=220686 RepID=UPI002FFD8EBD
MFKKLLALLLLSAFVQVLELPDPANAAGSPNLQVPVMSDVHINLDLDERQTRFKNALQEYQQLAPHYQALVVNGDMTDQGLVTQYNRFNQLLGQYANPKAEKVMVMGNHEFYQGVYWPNPDYTEQTFIDRFVAKTGMPGLYYDMWVKGQNADSYHFIVLGSEQSRITNGGNDDMVTISDEQYQWLEKALSQNTDPKKPIFVFLHIPIDNTIYGSEEWGGHLLDGRLKGILSHYPQVILFSGHLHYLLQHPRSVYQDGFTMVDTGALAYTLYGNGNAPEAFSQGLLVNVYNDKVEIKAREFSSHTWVNHYTVKLPFVKTIDDTQNPAFKWTSKPSVNKVTDTTAAISWPPAQDNTMVDRYVIKQDGKVLQTIYTKFWEADPTSYTASMSKLKGNTDYTYEIYAVDAWNNESEPLKVTLKTDKYNGWIVEGGNTYYYDYKSGKPVTGWFKYNAKWYYFNAAGVMQKGWIKDKDKWYFLNNNGSMAVGWLYVKGSWYYLDSSGMMKTGWIFTNQKWYYLTTSGAMKIGWLLLNNSWYYLDESGMMKTGWVLTGNKWYYLYKDGRMAANTMIGSYRLGKDGAWIP